MPFTVRNNGLAPVTIPGIGTIEGRSFKDNVERLTPALQKAIENNLVVVTGSDSSGGANTGNVTFELNRIFGSGAGSGDGYGYATLELIPDRSLTTNGQYIILDPTTPNHIHIRAGGDQDASPAELFLGGERNYVRTSDGEYGGVRAQQYTQYAMIDYYADGNEFIAATWQNDGDENFIEFTSTNVPFIDQVFALGNNEANYLTLYYGDGSSQQVTYGFFSTSMQNPVFKMGVLQAPPEPSVALTAIEVAIFEDRYSYIELESRDVNIRADNDLRLAARDEARLTSDRDVVSIHADYDNTDRRWEFRTDGMMEFPHNARIGFKQEVPATSNGQTGDKRGMFAMDSTFIYYCVDDYTDGVADIWKRTGWSEDTW